jgi:hypothetical protein
MAGDSIARLAFGALLRHLSIDGTQQMVFGHQDFEYELPCGIRASFFWAPYADNVTSLVEGWSSAGTVPDVLVMGTALWHMLHVGVPQDYGNKLSNLANALSRLESQVATHNLPPLPCPTPHPLQVLYCEFVHFILFFRPFFYMY